MTLDQPATVSYGKVAVLYVCVALMTLMLTWTFLGMRAVMDVGGMCASGGPYEIAQPCPDGTALLSVAIPVMLVATLLGSAIAASVAAPTLLLPMWWLLFGSLGWNFLSYGAFDGEIVWGWLICGVMFELMALPALLFQLPWGPTGPARLNPRPVSAWWWWVAYGLLGLTGVVLGVLTFNAWT